MTIQNDPRRELNAGVSGQANRSIVSILSVSSGRDSEEQGRRICLQSLLFSSSAAPPRLCKGVPIDVVYATLRIDLCLPGSGLFTQLGQFTPT